jgi:hypothetical protein
MAIRMILIKWIDSSWRRLRRRHRIKAVRRVESMHELPDDVGVTLYIVGLSKPKWVVLSCPCRCGARIDVNLMASREPAWTLSGADKEITLNPSLWMSEKQCGSHFFIRRGRILWV